MRKRKAAPQDKNQDALLGEIQRLRQQVHQLQLERDILTKANELIKKDLGISFLTLKNREKTLIVDALKKKYPVAELLSVLQLARSCYFYHKASKRLCDKYAEIRVIMADIFEENYRCYGYRRLHAMLRGNNRVISEKVVRRLMAEEQLVVKRTRRRRYNSYCGEIGPAPENLLARDFSSCRPNEKWLTDITEFQLLAGKVGTVAKLAMRQPFVLFKGLTFQKLCLPGAFRPGDHHNKMLRPGLCVVHASPQYL